MIKHSVYSPDLSFSPGELLTIAWRAVSHSRRTPDPTWRLASYNLHHNHKLMAPRARGKKISKPPQQLSGTQRVTKGGNNQIGSAVLFVILSLCTKYCSGMSFSFVATCDAGSVVGKAQSFIAGSS